MTSFEIFKHQIEPGVILEDPRGKRRTVLEVDGSWLLLSHKGTNFVDGRRQKWHVKQLFELGDRIVYRPLKEPFVRLK